MTVSTEALAARLRAAYSGPAIPPMRDGLAPTDAEGAYAVQAANTAFWRSEGRRVVGRKIGLTAKAVQAQLGVDRPDYGVLFADMAIENGGCLLASRVIAPKAEAEVALVLARDLDQPALTAHDVMAATAYAIPAIEIVDSRIADWKITFADTVADNGSSAFFVLGDTPYALDGLDLLTCGMVLEINGEIVSLGAGAACLGHPLRATAWLASTLSQMGEPLRAGDLILSGALGPMAAIAPGDQVRATIGGMGSVGFTFLDDRR